MKRFMFIFMMSLLVLSLVATKTDSKLPKDIVFLMTFDEGKGNKIADLSGNGNSGEIVGAADWINGKYDNALHFDGKTHVTVPNAPPIDKLTHPMSVGAWVNPDSLGGWRNIVEMDGGAGWKFGFRHQMIVWTTYHVKDFIGQTTIPTKEWTHVAATWDGKEAIIYVNGEEDKGGPIAGGGVINVAKEPSLDIGFRRTSGSSFFIGGMDELWVSNTVKTQKEIQEFMDGFQSLLAVDSGGKIASIWGNIKKQ
ncbi:TPA: LamG domain-containing protein [Candidatus Poribacteria bacterium]|nr:LamG domain-containing protein [Candidatus Poribacteria bacterium]